MKVKELINKLREMDGEMRVVVLGHDAEVNVAGLVVEVDIDLNVYNDRFLGRHRHKDTDGQSSHGGRDRRG